MFRKAIFWIREYSLKFFSSKLKCEFLYWINSLFLISFVINFSLSLFNNFIKTLSTEINLFSFTNFEIGLLSSYNLFFFLNFISFNNFVESKTKSTFSLLNAMWLWDKACLNESSFFISLARFFISETAFKILNDSGLNVLVKFWK